MEYLIVGNGDYARMMNRYLKNTNNISAIGFTVKRSFISKKTIDGIPVIPTEEILNRYNTDVCKLIMGIGYRNMNQIKQQEFIRYKEMGYTFENYIHPTAIIENDVVIGEGNNIFEGVIVQAGTKIGNANLIYGGALIAHENIIGNYNSFSVKACIAGCTRIGNNCFIGANSTIRDHIVIDDFTLVGAGAYVDKDTNCYDVIVPQKSVQLEGRKSTEFI